MNTESHVPPRATAPDVLATLPHERFLDQLRAETTEAEAIQRAKEKSDRFLDSLTPDARRCHSLTDQLRTLAA